MLWAGIYLLLETAIHRPQVLLYVSAWFWKSVLYGSLVFGLGPILFGLFDLRVLIGLSRMIQSIAEWLSGRGRK